MSLAKARVNTKQVQDRRPVRYASLEELRRDAERLAHALVPMPPVLEAELGRAPVDERVGLDACEDVVVAGVLAGQEDLTTGRALAFDVSQAVAHLAVDALVDQAELVA